MPKTFYTERDIEDLARRGGQSLELNEDVVLTELAYEKAERLGIKLVREHVSRPNAPVRPYLSTANPRVSLPSSSPQETSSEDLKKRIHSAVIARLGNQVDPSLLDTIINRVLKSTGIN